MESPRSSGSGWQNYVSYTHFPENLETHFNLLIVSKGACQRGCLQVGRYVLVRFEDKEGFSRIANFHMIWRIYAIDLYVDLARPKHQSRMTGIEQHSPNSLCGLQAARRSISHSGRGKASKRGSLSHLCRPSAPRQ